MKKIKLFVVNVLIIILSTTILSVYTNAIETESSETITSMYEFMIKKICTNDNCLDFKTNNFKSTNYNFFNFPVDYGGAFYDNGFLNVNLTSFDNKFFYDNILNNSYVKYHKVKLSLNDLLYIQKCLYNINDNYIITSSICQKNNNIDIEITNENAIKKIKNEITSKGFDPTCLNFFITKNASNPLSIDNEINHIFHTSLNTNSIQKYAYPGDRVYYWNGNQRGSAIATIGFNAKNNTTNQYGYVTAEHALWNRSALGNNETNMASVAQCTASKSVDACFVPFNNSNYVASGLINNNSLYGSTIYHINSSYTSNANLEGFSLTRFGKSSKIKTVVVSAYCNYTLNGGDGTIIYNALKLSSNPAEGGDSGGPIGFVKSDNSVILAGITSSADDQYTYAPKISDILSALNISLVG